MSDLDDYLDYGYDEEFAGELAELKKKSEAARRQRTAEAEIQLIEMIAKMTGPKPYIDRIIGGAFALMNSGIEKLKDVDKDNTEQPAPDQSCAVKSGALPVSTALKAIDYGALKIAFRVLPKQSIDLLKSAGLEVIAKMEGRLLAVLVKKTVKKRIPLAGDIAAVIAGTLTAKGYNDAMIALLRAVLGCVPNSYESSPMRYALNGKMQRVKSLGKREARKVKNVHTRKKDGNGIY